MCRRCGAARGLEKCDLLLSTDSPLNLSATSAWEQLLDGLDIEQRAAVLGQVKSPEFSADKRSIKTAIDGGVHVPGACLVSGRHSLRRS